MNLDFYLLVILAITTGLLALLLAVAIPRGKRIQKTNEQIEANQRRQMDLSERQTKAAERIAEALEARK